MSDLKWHDAAELYGVRVKAFFFNAKEVNAREDFVERNLPVFQKARPKLLCTEQDRRNFRVGELIGQPDAVLEHGNGLISLEYKSYGGYGLRANTWNQELKLKDMLQCIAGAMAVATALGKPTAAVLRAHNALFLLDPQAALVDVLATKVPEARAYFQESRSVSISQLADFCVPLVKIMFPSDTPRDQAKKLAGQVRHEEMLRA